MSTPANQLALGDGATLPEILNVTTKPAVITVNFEELKTRLSAELERYDVVVTADTVKDAKALATDLNKTAKAIDDQRKEIVNEVSGPVRAFEERMKELRTMCKDGRTKILDQIEVFENETRALAQTMLADLAATLFHEKNVTEEFQKIDYSGLVKTDSVTAGGKLTRGARTKLEAMVAEARAKQDKVKMRLVTLENRSYRAGLKSPLTRDHVEQFLFADDAHYEAQLQRLIAAEVTRQEETEKQLREQMEKEAQTASPPPAEPPPESEEEWTPPAETAQPEPPPPAETPPNGKVRFIVTATFDIAAPATATSKQIENKLRQRLEAAGITSLASVEVARA